MQPAPPVGAPVGQAPCDATVALAQFARHLLEYVTLSAPHTCSGGPVLIQASGTCVPQRALKRSLHREESLLRDQDGPPLLPWRHPAASLPESRPPG